MSKHAHLRTGAGRRARVTGDASEPLAAVDLGSNSFHMIVARFHGGRMEVIDRMRDRVRLAAGLDAENRLTPKARDRALRCLEAFRACLDYHDVRQVATAGTCTFRLAKNGRSLRRQAETTLGHRIRIIDGLEEARLVYLGVAREAEPCKGPRLVVDIGGGSTECVVGRRSRILEAASVDVGCVSTSRRFFADGRITRGALKAGIKAAREALAPHAARFGADRWGRGFASSGTARTTGRVLAAAGWSDGDITARGLGKLRKALIEAGSIDALNLPGLKSSRRPVYPGGVVAMSAVFQAFDIDALTPVRPALREGLVHDLHDGLVSADGVIPTGVGTGVAG